MLAIRLRRIGRKNDPHYRIVVAEHTAPVQGKFIAELGHYHPKSKECVIRQEEFMTWLNKGAKPSNTVAKLAQRAKLEHKQIVVIQEQGKPKKKAQEAAAAKEQKSAQPAEAPAEAPVEETPETPAETEAEEPAAEETPEEPTESEVAPEPQESEPEEMPAE